MSLKIFHKNPSISQTFLCISFFILVHISLSVSLQTVNNSCCAVFCWSWIMWVGFTCSSLLWSWQWDFSFYEQLIKAETPHLLNLYLFIFNMYMQKYEKQYNNKKQRSGVGGFHPHSIIAFIFSIRFMKKHFHYCHILQKHPFKLFVVFHCQTEVQKLEVNFSTELVSCFFSIFSGKDYSCL